jgi:hypothetical protein
LIRDRGIWTGLANYIRKVKKRMTNSQKEQEMASSLIISSIRAIYPPLVGVRTSALATGYGCFSVFISAFNR